MDKYESKVRRFETALATRNFEIELFWKRSLFFWGFIASTFVAYVALIDKIAFLSVAAACFGLVCSIAWSCVNRGSKYWQENWETLVEEAESEVTGELFTLRRERHKDLGWLGARKFSVSRSAIALSDFTCCSWVGLLAFSVTKALNIKVSLSLKEAICLLIVFTVVYLLCFLIKVGSKDADINS